MTIADLTDQQLIRIAKRFDRTIRQYGGCEYGWDWATLRLTMPALAQSFSEIVAEGRKRQLHRPESERIPNV